MLSRPFAGLQRQLSQYICPSCLHKLHQTPNTLRHPSRTVRSVSSAAKVDTRGSPNDQPPHSEESERAFVKVRRQLSPRGRLIVGQHELAESSKHVAADRRTPHQLRKQKLRLKAAPSVKIRKTVGAGPRKIRQYASADPDARQEVPQTAGGQLRIRKHTVAHKEDEPNRTKEEKKRSRSASRNNSETEKGDNDLKLTMKGIRSLTTAGLKLTPLSVEQSAMIPRLCHGLDRVLFNPGVYQIQDPRSRVFNFDPFLQKVLPVSEFNFNALQQFETSSQDATLKALAKQRRGVKYYGSTSSMTGILKHFHFLLSQWRTLNFPMLSREFDVKNKRFSQFTKMPAAVFLRYQRGQYALDADKYFDRQNVMSLLGQSLERFLTLPPREYNRYRLSHANRITSEEEASRSNAYNYTAAGSILMRSQLDAYDPRLPGTGVFDVKTRAVVSVRAHSMDSDHSGGMGYEIRERHGQWESFEREMYDLIRNTMLSYSLQARIGRMDGIFMAYHNIERIFGFQYLSMEDLDRALHGQKDPYLGDEEFKLSLKLLQKVLNQITERFPKQTVRLHFETRDDPAFMYIFAEPMTEKEADDIQRRNKRKNEKLTKQLLGLSEHESEEDDIDQDEDDAAAWSKLRNKVDQQISGQEADESRSRGVIDAEENDDELSFERRLLRMQISAEELNKRVERAKNAAAAEEHRRAAEGSGSDDWGLSELPGEAGVRPSEAEFVAVSSSLYQLERRVAGIAGEIEAEQGDNSKLLFYVNHTRNLIKAQVEHIAEHASHLVVNVEGDSKTQATDPARKGKAIQEHAKQWPPKTKEEHFAGDSEFKTSRNTRPMLALTLTIRNKVNSAAVGRPENLTTDDAWKVEYSFSEIQNARQAWALYEATKKRRADILDEDIFSYPMHEFKKQVSEWVKKGREWRVEQDKLDEEKGERVIFEPYDRGVEAEQVHEVEEEVTSSAPEADAPSQTPEKGATARKVLSLSARRRSKDREKARMAKEARQLARRYPSETDV